MRAILAIGLSGGVLLSACAQPIPDSGAGVGFGDYAQYELERARREAALTGAPAGGLAPLSMPAATYPVTAGPAAYGPAYNPAPVGASGSFGMATGSGSVTSADLAAAGIGTGGAVLPATSPAIPAAGWPAASAPAVTTASAPAAAPTTEPAWNPQADPLRDSGLEARPSNAAPVIVPGAAATAPAVPTGPNIVEYALSTTNQRGEPLYSRFIFSTQARMQRNCADYASADDAQRDFLARGGPRRDPRGLDPDGDGFACAWDPAPFRAAVRG
ncbi:hypothetical protein ruthe_02595 [Rubellimicrobium thermophilum DSM 16684]|uniref:Excalibur calcium-binding domain-containing protein n=1 Tax=Rubellimicrobium thermophilum DSM 16684 TaxID=1123069 RepID=S9QW13_9RHOB|nr:hypothetical protein [Rubellimicrobium thermophilum]EPX83798.1 hypothetical protein ruthe_02595 [Rubellimicrobium thermophilum DSM 16684]